MYFIYKKLDEITESDLQQLIDGEIIEKKIIEYKSELSVNTKSEKKEFLADVSSFANASSGDIIFGITEDRKTGKPESLNGIEIENVDQEIIRLDHIIRDGIEPNIPSSLINIQEIPLANSNYILILRIGKSWLGPHRISYSGWNQFYSRANNGKYRLDIQELRSAFILSETIGDKIKQFRENRISDIHANELPLPFYSSPKIVLHLIPYISFKIGQIYDFSKLSLYDIQPIGYDTFDHRYNIDGLLTYSSFPKKERSFSYTQLFKNGIIEAVNSELLWPREGDKIMPITDIEEELIEYIPVYINVYNKLGIDPPVFIFLTFIDVKDYKSRKWSNDAYPIDRTILQIPEIMIEDFAFNPTQILKPMFDSIWNACGYARSPNYNKDGERNP